MPVSAKRFVSSIPRVLAAGAASLGMNTVALSATTEGATVPIGTLQQFQSAAAVGSYFGLSSPEYAFALVYFAGFDGSTRTSTSLYLAQYNTAAVGAYLRSASLAGMTIAQLQALSGTITVAVNGETVTSANITLAGASTFTAAANLIQMGLQTVGGIFSGTASIAGGTLSLLNVTGVTSGTLHVGDVVAGPGLTVGTTIASFGSGTGGIGTYNLSAPASGAETAQTYTVSSTATCTYNNQLAAFVISSPTTGATSTIAYPTDNSLSPALSLTTAKGAVLSQGAAVATPSSLMSGIVGLSQDWAAFTTITDPDNGAAGGPIKQLFAEWNATQQEYYTYVAYDSDVTPSLNTGDASCFAAQVAALEGTIPIWSSTQGPAVAAFVCGIIASINFQTVDGRTDFAYRASPALTPDVTSDSVYGNITGNGYNCYCDVSTRASQFQWFQPGSISGTWKWIDAYVDQLYWNAQFQNDFATYLSQVPFTPYNAQGFNQIRQALSTDIQAMGSFGAWVPGVTLSGTQAAEVNADAGITIAPTLQNQGWYLLVADPGPTVRAARGSPIVKFYYTDGGSVQVINMSSTDVQ